MNDVTVQASRNGIRVGDLVGDFDLFMEKWVHLVSLSLSLYWLCHNIVTGMRTSECVVFLLQVSEVGQHLREALSWLASGHGWRVGVVQGTFVCRQMASLVIVVCFCRLSSSGTLIEIVPNGHIWVSPWFCCYSLCVSAGKTWDHTSVCPRHCILSSQSAKKFTRQAGSCWGRPGHNAGHRLRWVSTSFSCSSANDSQMELHL